MSDTNEGGRKLKICGITSLEDARFASGAMADYLGFVFFEGSKRYIEPSKAGAIINWLHGPETVGVFVNETAESVNEIARMTGLDWVQLHGEETPDMCARIEKPVIKAIHVKDWMTSEDLRAAAAPYFEVAKMLLFDTSDVLVWGGTGRSFDWSLLRDQGWPLPVMVAGGIGPDNLAQAFEESGAEAADLSSSVEVSPGVKDMDKINEVMEVMRGYWEA